MKRSLKESARVHSKEEAASVSMPASTRPMPRRRGPLHLAVTTKRQTHEQQRQYSAALDGFLAEMVRQHLEAEKERS